MLARMRPLGQQQLVHHPTRSLPAPLRRASVQKHRPLQLHCNASAGAAAAGGGAGSQWPTPAAAAIAAAVQQQPVFQLAASVLRACQHFVAVARERVSQVLPHPPNVDKQVCVAQQRLYRPVAVHSGRAQLLLHCLQSTCQLLIPLQPCIKQPCIQPQSPPPPFPPHPSTAPSHNT
jgi:hypothetical protein